ncbi:MAG: hypothetical protein GY882_12915 [Actinomycetia bacterium]|nr:hypothetical protein [Actinomycetes bacterium]MCP4843472.1 hypothetical protein [Actinomycetes bacterium]
MSHHRVTKACHVFPGDKILFLLEAYEVELVGYDRYGTCRLTFANGAHVDRHPAATVTVAR